MGKHSKPYYDADPAFDRSWNDLCQKPHVSTKIMPLPLYINEKWETAKFGNTLITCQDSVIYELKELCEEKHLDISDIKELHHRGLNTLSNDTTDWVLPKKFVKFVEENYNLKLHRKQTTSKKPVNYKSKYDTLFKRINRIKMFGTLTIKYEDIYKVKGQVVDEDKKVNYFVDAVYKWSRKNGIKISTHKRENDLLITKG